MYKEALRGVEGLDISAAIAVVIFFTFFVGLIIYVIGYKTNHTDLMENMPLEEKDSVSEMETTEIKENNKTKNHE